METPLPTNMQFFVQSGSDGSFLEQILDPASIESSLVNGAEVFATLKQMQRMTDANTKTINGSNQTGYYINEDGTKSDGVKVIARFPESVMIALMAVEPDLLRDGKTFRRILKKYPIYKAYTRGAKE